MLKHLTGLVQQQLRQLSLFDAEPELPVAAPLVPTPSAPRRTMAPDPSAPARRELLLDGHPVAYTLRRARRRSIGFTVTAEGLAVAAPRWVSMAEIERALQDKSGWILRKLQEQRERARRIEAAAIAWGDGCSLPYLGQPLRLRLLPQPPRRAWLDEELRHLHLPLPPGADAAALRQATLAWLKLQARALFEQRCQHFGPALGVRHTRLSLSSAQTRWGSASSSGAIRLNWRLIHFEPSVIDYVVAHELAHLREMNHSERFWAIVSSVVPEHEQARRRLRDEVLPRLES